MQVSPWSVTVVLPAIFGGDDYYFRTVKFGKCRYANPECQRSLGTGQSSYGIFNLVQRAGCGLDEEGSSKVSEQDGYRTFECDIERATTDV